MRWFIDVTPMGTAHPVSRFCVEATRWQAALQAVRRARDEKGAFSSFYIELIDQGYRALHPESRTRYVVIRAPDDAAVTPGLTAIYDSLPPSEPPPMRTPVPRPLGQISPTNGKTVPAALASAPARSNGESSVFELVHKREEEPTPAVPMLYREHAYLVAPGTPLDDVARLLWDRFRDVARSIEHRSKGKFVQIAVFDHRFDTRPESPPLATLLWKDWRGNPALHFPGDPRRDTVRAWPENGDAHAPPSIPRPEAAAAVPVAQRPVPTSVAPAPAAAPAALSAPPAPSARGAAPIESALVPAVAPAPRAPAATVPLAAVAVPQAPVAASAALPLAAVAVPVAAPVAPPPAPPRLAPVAAPAAPSPAPVAPRLAPVAAPAAPSPAPMAAPVAPRLAPIVAPAAPSPAPMAAPPAVAVQAPFPASPSAAARVAPVVPAPAELEGAASVPAFLNLAPPTQAVAAVPAPVPIPAPIQPEAAAFPAAPAAISAEPVAPAPAVPAPTLAATVAPLIAPATVAPLIAPAPTPPIAPAPTPPVPIPISVDLPVASVRRHAEGEDLIGELFESTHDLCFVSDVVGGAQFVLGILAKTFPAELLVIHVFDINSGQFVVVRAQGTGADALILHRTPGTDPLLDRAMRRDRALCTTQASEDPGYQGGRWTKAGVVPRDALCGGVKLGGRYLGAIEVVNPLGDEPFHTNETNALDYICEQFAEFLAARPIVLDAEVVMEQQTA